MENFIFCAVWNLLLNTQVKFLKKILRFLGVVRFNDLVPLQPDKQLPKVITKNSKSTTTDLILVTSSDFNR